MANRVRVADLEFSSQKDARAFFYDIRDKYWGSQEVIEQGDSFTRLKELANAWCTGLLSSQAYWARAGR